MIRWLKRLRPGRGADGAASWLVPTVSATAATEAVTLAAGGGSLVRPAFGHLTVVEGPPRLLSRRFALRDDEVSIGRTESCYVSIPDARISRLHAQVVREGDGLWLVHRSQTNQSLLNGAPVADRAALHDGDQIQLADRVRLRLASPLHVREARGAGPRGLAEAMEARVELEERIARQFVRDGSFLDVDVVDSYHLKLAEERAERVVVSFERFRALIEGVVAESGGQVLNSNGDEVMAFFPGADAALAAGRTILARLPGWNEEYNLLPRPFEVRIGIHSGRSAVDLERGVAYSPVLDGAGHLQKAAPVGGLLLSKETWLALSSREGLVPARAAGKQGLEAFALGGTPG
jgi:class 3 adenylate cyclase